MRFTSNSFTLFVQADDIRVLNPSQCIELSFNEFCEASVLVEDFYRKLIVKAILCDLYFATSSYAKCSADPQVV